MSHTVSVSVSMTNRAALHAAATHLGLQFVGEANHALFDGQHQGLAFKLDGWHFPVVINPELGTAKYDNYGERWGKQDKLDELVQRYSCEVARLEAAAQGWYYNEAVQANGDIHVEMEQLVTA